MVSFKDYIEAFDTQHQLSAAGGGNYRYSRTFNIGEWEYTVTASLQDADENYWAISFGVDSGDDSDPYGIQSTKQLSAEKSAAAPPAIRVFAGVRQFIDAFIKDKHPGGFEFAAAKSEPSRISLYQALTPKLAQHYGYGYEVDNSGYEVRFILQKNAQPT